MDKSSSDKVKAYPEPKCISSLQTQNRPSHQKNNNTKSLNYEKRNSTTIARSLILSEIQKIAQPTPKQLNLGKKKENQIQDPDQRRLSRCCCVLGHSRNRNTLTCTSSIYRNYQLGEETTYDFLHICDRQGYQKGKYQLQNPLLRPSQLVPGQFLLQIDMVA